MNSHRHIFVHSLLPALLWNGDGTLGHLADPQRQAYLEAIWNSARPGLEASGCEASPPDGLSCSLHWIGGEHLVNLIQLPEPRESTEAYFVAITTSPSVEYLILEMGLALDEDKSAFFCSRTSDGTHCNFDSSPRLTRDDFLRKVCVHLGVPETIEDPSPAQLCGMRDGARWEFEKAMHMPLSEADKRQVDEWRVDADRALEAKDPKKAESLYRRILDLKISERGLQDMGATELTASLVRSIMCQDRNSEAEQVCREWWRTCRRYRMLAHEETMTATWMLAKCLRAQGRSDQGLALMRYRVQLAGLCRGKRSIQAKSAQEELNDWKLETAPTLPSNAEPKHSLDKISWWYSMRPVITIALLAVIFTYGLFARRKYPQYWNKTLTDSLFSQIPRSPTRFWIDNPLQPSLGRRTWTMTDKDTWAEADGTGVVRRFKVSGRIRFDSSFGTVVTQINDDDHMPTSANHSGLQVFIPSIESPRMRLWLRQSSNGHWKTWQILGYMREVE